MTRFTSTPRLYLDVPLTAGAEVSASSDQAHYLGGVLRRVTGDPVRVFNSRDGEWMARLGVARKGRATLHVAECLRPSEPEPGPWLVFALLKRDATDLVIRQATELGACRVLPVITARTNAARVNEDRLRAIAIEAAEQCERLTIPEIAPVGRLDQCLSGWPSGRRLFAAFERSGLRAGLPQAVESDAALLIGPEGGFTPEEISGLRAMAFITPVSLGLLVLRAETAAIAGLSLLLARG